MTNENDWLAKQFQDNRNHLREVAYRMLGSPSEAEDAVQEVWLRLSRSDTSVVDNLGGWLTTVLARVCLDMLRSRKSRREEPLELDALGPAAASAAASDPEAELALADSIGSALLLVLETLAPAERAAFVLHDMFDLPFEEIGPIVGRSPAAARQLASRARRRVRGEAADAAPGTGSRNREIVDAFLAASRGGDLDALLAALAPDVVLRVDEVALRVAAAHNWGGAAPLASEVRGASAVAASLKDRRGGVVPAVIDGDAGAAWAPGGRTRSVFVFTVERGKIREIQIIMDPARLAELDVELEPVPASSAP